MSEQYPLAPHGVFWTLQGEGAQSGEPMAFIRLAGCSVGCPECDTDYRVSRRLGVEELVQEVRAVVPAGFPMPWVWITGGEPTDHNLEPLISLLQTVGFRVALATSGVRRVTVPVQWLSVSPHSTEAVERHGHELKVVPGLNGLSWEAIEELSHWSFPWRYIQPLWGGENLQACIEFVRTHPGWRLSHQAHRVWGLP